MYGSNRDAWTNFNKIHVSHILLDNLIDLKSCYVELLYSFHVLARGLLEDQT